MGMQMYKGLDIVTYKVTPEERNLIKHHMIDFMDPMLKSTVIDFRNQALSIIEKLRSQSIIPVICGGTNYYIESFLWKMLVNEDNVASTVEPLQKMPKYDGVQTNELYAKLTNLMSAKKYRRK